MSEESTSASDLQAIKAERRQSLLRQRATLQASLNELELQRAHDGIRVPLDLINEIKVVRERLEQVEHELAQLGSGERGSRAGRERTEGVRVDSGGGAVILGDVHVEGDFIGRDRYTEEEDG